MVCRIKAVTQSDSAAQWGPHFLPEAESATIETVVSAAGRLANGTAGRNQKFCDREEKVTCWHFRLTCRLTLARSRQIFTRALMRSRTLSRCYLEAQPSSVRANLPHGRASGHRQPHLPAPSTESPRQREKTKRPVSVARYRSCAAGRRPRCLGRLQHGSGCGPNPYDCAVR